MVIWNQWDFHIAGSVNSGTQKKPLTLILKPAKVQRMPNKRYQKICKLYQKNTKKKNAIKYI